MFKPKYNHAFSSSTNFSENTLRKESVSKTPSHKSAAKIQYSPLLKLLGLKPLQLPLYRRHGYLFQILLGKEA